MLKQLIKFYHISTPATPLKKDKKKLKRLQWATFLSATAGYGIYYVCRLSLNVVKKPIVEEGIFSETELGIIGAVLFFTYAIGKFTNGFLADRSNIRRFMSTGLLITALANLLLGFGVVVRQRGIAVLEVALVGDEQPGSGSVEIFHRISVVPLHAARQQQRQPA